MISDSDENHYKVLGVIEQARIPGFNKMFGRIIDSYEKHQYLAVGYWKPSLNIFQRGELLTIDFDGKAILKEPSLMGNAVY